MPLFESHSSRSYLWVGESHIVGGEDGDDTNTESARPLEFQNSNPILTAKVPISNIEIVLDLEPDPNTDSNDPNTGGNHSPTHSPHSNDSTQFVIESPINQPNNIIPVGQTTIECFASKGDRILNEEMECASESDLGDDLGEEISLEEAYNSKGVQSQRSQKREKKASRGKALQSMAGQVGGGKILKHALGKQLKNFKHKYERKRRKKGKRKESSHTSQEATADDSISEENSRNRNEEIHRAASVYWKLGLALGMSADEPTDNVPKLMVDLEERDWDAYERRHNE